MNDCMGLRDSIPCEASPVQDDWSTVSVRGLNIMKIRFFLCFLLTAVYVYVYYEEYMLHCRN